MFRGSTPLCMFIFPSDPREYDEIEITYSQRRKTLIEKTKDDLTFGVVGSKDLYTAYFYMTQEETLMFDHKYVVSVQIRIYKDFEDPAKYLTGERCFSSSVYTFDVEDILNGEVISK